MPFFQFFSKFPSKRGGFPARASVRPQMLTELFTHYALSVKRLQSNFSAFVQYMKEVFNKRTKNEMKFSELPRVQEIREELQRIRDARAELLEMGQSTSLQGSHAVTRVRLEELDHLERVYQRQLLNIAESHGLIPKGAGTGRKKVKYE